MKAATLSVTINRDPGTVYAFTSNAENLPKWAKGLDKSVRVRFVAKNEFGVADHYVAPAPGVEVYVPVRVVANGSGSEVLFTLFQMPQMTDEQFAQDRKLVEQDLATLKHVLEA